MEQSELLGLLAQTDYFELHPETEQLRYKGGCPVCGSKTQVYFRKTLEKSWRCHNCKKTFTSREIPGLTELIYDLLSL